MMNKFATRFDWQNIMYGNSGKLCAVCVAALVAWLSMAATPVDNTQAVQQTEVRLSVITASELPVEARDTLRVIKKGGPFAYDRDASTFGNFEQILPKQPRGYYHEYTVKTPGVRNRGARRIVCGPLPECYYSADHYQTFKRIVE